MAAHHRKPIGINGYRQHFSVRGIKIFSFLHVSSSLRMRSCSSLYVCVCVWGGGYTFLRICTIRGRSRLRVLCDAMYSWYSVAQYTSQSVSQSRWTCKYLYRDTRQEIWLLWEKNEGELSKQFAQLEFWGRKKLKTLGPGAGETRCTNGGGRVWSALSYRAILQELYKWTHNAQVVSIHQSVRMFYFRI
jgi:hypothetical protein